ncbi:unnamed protein product [Plutella xylostella]|uniref:(diamondback moth) hypothetical protein n=1 Tax=Plutella xylostella TaxID=51655 RepID=A0A8S4G329_PLUXY|nr:unnamed protein product [Plutella xylostella]
MSNPSLSSSSIAAQNQLVTWLNEAGLAEGGRRAELLRKAAEVLLHQLPALLPAHLDLVLSHAADKHTDVKKVVIGFIEQISSVSPDLLPRCVALLGALAGGGGAAAVQKRAIQAASLVFRNALLWLPQAALDRPADAKLVWDELTKLKLVVLNLVDNDNEGIRTHSVKFLEEVVHLQTPADPGAAPAERPPPLPALPGLDRAALQQEAEHIFQLLVKFHSSAHISAVNLMACTAALCGLARARARHAPPAARALAALLQDLPPTLSQGIARPTRSPGYSPAHPAAERRASAATPPPPPPPPPDATWSRLQHHNM